MIYQGLEEWTYLHTKVYWNIFLV